MAGDTNISVGHIDSKFGISIHQLPHLVRIVENTKMSIVDSLCIRRYIGYWSVFICSWNTVDAAKTLKI
jgi:hypothetical protein